MKRGSLPVSPRIINIASKAGSLRILKSVDKKKLFTSPELSITSLCSLVDEFINDVQLSKHQENGWPNSNYGMSKLAVIALTKILATEEENLRMHHESQGNSDKFKAIRYFSCCPGWCSTDMSSHSGNKTAEEGARTPFLLATMDESHPFTSMTGGFFSDEDLTEW
jgi:carbonyl reductase 1